MLFVTISALIIVGVFSPSVAASNAKPIAIYVAPSGNDAWSGQIDAPNHSRSDGPFATLGRAQLALRDLPQKERASRGVTISLRGGTYFLPSPLQLNEIDSGAAGAPTVIQAYPGESVTLSGGCPVRTWRTWKGNILQANVSGITSWTQSGTPGRPLNVLTQSNELFFNGTRMELARWPKRNGSPEGGEWAVTTGVPIKGSRTQFYYQGDAPSRWLHPEKAQAHIFPWADWMENYCTIASIDANKHLITLSTPTFCEIKPGRRFFVRNVLEELDSPGEWYLDNDAGILYFYPPTKEIEAKPADISVLPSIFMLNHAQRIILRNLTIEDVTGTAVDAISGSDNHIEGCEIRNTGAGAISISGGVSYIVDGCLIHDNNGGISINAGDRTTLTSSNIEISNNHIFRYDVLGKCYTAAIGITGVGVTVTHNLIHDGPHVAISLWQVNDLTISYNEIHHVCLSSADCGAIYMGRDWTWRGNKILCNKIHDVPGYYCCDDYNEKKQTVRYASFGASGVYLDDGMSGFDVEGNIIYRISDRGVQLGGGRDNRIANNIFVDNGNAIGADARYAKSGEFVDGLSQPLAKIHYNTPPWSVRYPKLAAPMRHPGWPEGNEIVGNIVAKTPLHNPGRPKGNEVIGSTVVKTINVEQVQPLVSYAFPSDAVTIDRNIYWNDSAPVVINESFIDRDGSYNKLSWENWQKTGFDANGLAADPLFVASERDDYRLRSDSPAYKIGYPKFAWEMIGLLPSFPKKWLPAPDAWDNKPFIGGQFYYPVTLVPTPEPGKDPSNR